MVSSLKLASGTVLGAIRGPVLTDHESRFFSQFPVAGLTLFKRNVSAEFTAIEELTASLQKLSAPGHLPLMIAIDQEGGRVSRLGPPFPNRGPALQLEDGRSDSQALKSIFTYGHDVGRGLIKLGVNVNFAPVCDILTEQTNIAIGDRVFGLDAESVRERAGAFLDGLTAARVLGCLKHFPGQGNALHDTHKSTCNIDLEWDILDQRELVPFKSLVKRAPMVMMSHCLYSAVDPAKPASLSPVWINEILRKQMGFQGVVVSDDMIMEAIPQSDSSWESAIIEAIAAGTDLVLVCNHVEKTQQAVEAIMREMENSSVFSERVKNAAARVEKLRARI